MSNVSRADLYIDVVERTYKGRPSNWCSPSKIEVGNVYVLDWRPEEPERYDSITVESVEQIDGATVRTNRGDVDLFQFASMVVAEFTAAGTIKASPATPSPPA